MNNTQPCGTNAAYRRHLKQGTSPCQPCHAAYRAYKTQRRRNQGAQPMPLNPQDTAAEVAFLLSCGEGEHAILKALNIKPGALEVRLRRAGRPDLIPRVLNGDKQMVWAA